MNSQFNLPLTDLSIERSLEQYLLINLSSFNINSLSFYLIHSELGIIYQCSIALKLAKGNLKLAQEINHKIIYNCLVLEAKYQLEIEVFCNNYGLLEFLIKYSEINQWLQKLPELFLANYPLSLFNQHPTDINDEIFLIQYAHARCCSLLRLGHLDHLIQLKTLDFHQLTWFWLSPNLVIFNHIIWQQAEEQELIAQIIKVIDGKDRVNSIKIASDLSNTFLKFEQSCRIWGEVKRQDLTLAQARLGMIAIVQLLLRFGLTEKLGVIPLMEL
ncbi:hypothetical protein C7H19_08375 [Aphanothece hegewaldii CCALA 016]|uniref:DALR anticodon binding domain-containing protein n=1 Tax=Aphanothece hegewaldii CCALA 016 TaxID=2107694 RepID=A0A2T1M014_9CHRO|nr:DALR anticodon-binding domain-containing protein [Aphanothece hegewaldii]PSF37977.1 hypothetical protein C7H19_08375 [Aphanothece hegewaldii CCALA 016]